MSIYIESSSILSWLLGEPKESTVRELIDQSDKVVISSLTEIEVLRSLNRALSQGIIKHGHIYRLIGMFRKAAQGWYKLEFSEEVQRLAAQTFPLEPVRSLDAIHLASALVALEIFPELRVLSFDQRILDNLEPLGLQSAL